ncbi:MAG: hypothetical protein IMZ65_01710 [Planctomycetes bacterium]|nr:hypothetical protein [Planctomycetota bacterium]
MKLIVSMAVQQAIITARLEDTRDSFPRRCTGEEYTSAGEEGEWNPARRAPGHRGFLPLCATGCWQPVVHVATARAVTLSPERRGAVRAGHAIDRPRGDTRVGAGDGRFVAAAMLLVLATSAPAADPARFAGPGYRLSYRPWQRVFNVGFRVVCEGE